MGFDVKMFRGFVFFVFLERYTVCVYFHIQKYALMLLKFYTAFTESVCCTKVSKFLETFSFLRMFYCILYIKRQTE